MLAEISDEGFFFQAINRTGRDGGRGIAAAAGATADTTDRR